VGNDFGATPLWPDTDAANANDAELEAVAAELGRLDRSGERFGRAIRRTFDMLLDGQHTGRFKWDQLHKTEKTHCGTLIEINLQREFDFADGADMDYSILGIDVDCKYSQDFGKWMIPPEASGHLCLGLWANDYEGRWSAGLFRVTEDILSQGGGNRDKKRNLTAAARDGAVTWLYQNSPLPDNVLLRLSSSDIKAIFASQHGTKRLDELFRRAQQRLVSRTAVATVAQQEDYMKRIRGNGGSRSALRPEGIVIFGQYAAHGKIAAQLGLPVPSAGQSLSVRLARARSHHVGLPSVMLDGAAWVVAQPQDPVEPAPLLPEVRKGEDVD
jgi:hypothetical protein